MVQALLQIDWAAMFVPKINIGEIVLRGTLAYLFLFVILRIMRREAGTIGISDLLVVVLIADAIQNAMSSEYESVTEGAILVGTIAFWDFFLDWLGYKYPRIQRILHPPPLLLIKNGRMLKKNMQQEMISRDELMTQLREQGVENISEVKKCYLEGDGRISVIKKGRKDDNDNKQEKLIT